MNMDECNWTIEKALEVCIIMEEGAIKLYSDAQYIVKDHGSKKLLKELILDELKHKEYFVKALKDPKKLLNDNRLSDQKKIVIDLGVSNPLIEAPLSYNANYQDVLIFAAKSEKMAYEFYSALSKHFNGHPLSNIWLSFAQMELGHKFKIEKEYDDIILKEN